MSKSETEQATLELDHDDRASLKTPDGDHEPRREQLGSSPYCRNPSPVETKQNLEYDYDCCQNCGSHVTPRYRRSMGDQDNIAHHCPECDDVSQRERFAGLAADPDRDIAAARGGSTGLNTDRGGRL